MVEVLLVWAGVEPAPLRTSPLFPLEMSVVFLVFDLSLFFTKE